MTRTEITVMQWLEFVEAYAPHAPNPTDPGMLGRNISRVPGGGFQIYPGTEQFPANMSWRSAARYANWLHNGRVNEAWAFESGAYDASTFTQDPVTGRYNDQRAHSPGARFWIPTLDEWVKAAYYDPNRYGSGQEGYWRMPASRNELLISGYPHEGGETNADILNLPFPVGMDVGSYPHVTSPWGLLDLSGGENEWTETLETVGGVQPGWRSVRGPGFGGSRIYDFIDGPPRFHSPTINSIGVRIASVPAPTGFVLTMLCVTLLATRRFR